MKKQIAVALALATAATMLFAGCAKGENSNSASKGSGDAIQLLNGKPEIDAQMQELAKAYEEETGKKLEVLTIGGNETASSKLKELYQAGEMPDIFVLEANQFANWSGKLVDMSDQQWTEDTEVEYVNEEGTLGFPYMVEACGLAYNADILEKAGVDPASLTSPEAYKEAFATLDSKKDELGLTAVVGYNVNATDVGWSSGTHVFGQYLDAGLATDDTTYIDMLNDGGKLDEERFTAFGEFIGMLNQYTDPALITGSYDDQVLGFASGKYAFVTQGSWIGATLTGDDLAAYEEAGSFKVGFAPYAFEDGITTILNEPTSFWGVYKDGNVEDAEAFLQWASEDTAQRMFVEDMGFVSPYVDCAYSSTDPFAASVTEWLGTGKHSSYHTFLKKDGLQDATSVIFQNYAKGQYKDATEFYNAMQEATTAYYANN